MTTFLRLLEIDAKATPTALHAARSSSLRYDVEPSDLRSLPGSPFAYWLSAPLRERLAEADEPLLDARIGAGTLADFRFLRLWWEVPISQSGWRSFAKGGAFSRFYLDLEYMIHWFEDGKELREAVARKVGSASRKVQSVSHYFRPGLFWSRRSQKGLSVRALPGGSIFADTGPAAFVDGDDPDSLAALLAITNSSIFLYLVGLYVGFGSYEVGVLQEATIPPSAARHEGLSERAVRSFMLARQLDTVNETSHAFVLPALLQVEGRSVVERIKAWSTHVADVERRSEALRGEIDELCFDLYGISEMDRRAITGRFGAVESPRYTDDRIEDVALKAGADDHVTLAEGLMSWAAGVAFGRFDVRLATGERERRSDPGPFEPLSPCSDAMLWGDLAVRSVHTPAGYPLVTSPVLVYDRGHELDIVSRVRGVFDVVFGSSADRWWEEIGDVLPARRDAERWLASDLVGYHWETTKRQSRKAPILWPLGTESGSYLVWLYAHQVTDDSLFQVLNDIVGPKVVLEQRRLTELIQEAGQYPSASQRKAIDTQETLVGELRGLRDRLETVAPLWAPYLIDGIVIVLAPLWRLFAHHRPWSRELKKHWDKLTVGDYDWAQLAMRLWPERVIPKCAEDRSLAIAHGLEDVFWVQDADNTKKWHPRPAPTTPIDQLIADRQDPATKAALQQAGT